MIKRLKAKVAPFWTLLFFWPNFFPSQYILQHFHTCFKKKQTLVILKGAVKKNELQKCVQIKSFSKKAMLPAIWQPKIFSLNKKDPPKPTLSRLEQELHLTPPRPQVHKHTYHIPKVGLQSWTVAATALAFLIQLFRADPQRMKEGMKYSWGVGMPRKITRSKEWFDTG